MEGLPPSVRLLGIGFYVGFCILLMTIGGRELDHLLDTGKALTIVGLALGLVMALWGGIHQLMDVLQEIDRKRTEGKPD